MSSSSTSSFSRRYPAAALAALAMFLAMDHYLYAMNGMLGLAGYGTQEGQIARKADRAPALAFKADIIMFGSSYVRSGIASEPFFQKGLLPFNYGITGAGPAFAYFALEDLREAIGRRGQKPVLLMEIKEEPLKKFAPGSGEQVWSEYFHLNALLRQNGRMMANFLGLYRLFSHYEMSSDFIGSLALPSRVYRIHGQAFAVGLARLAPPFYGGGFHGEEDFGGYSPLYNSARYDDYPRAPMDPLPMDSFAPPKLRYLEKWIELGMEMKCRVILLQTPSGVRGPERTFDNLFAHLERRYPGLIIIRRDRYMLEFADVEYFGGHPNTRGAEIIANRIIEDLKMEGSREALAAKMDGLFHAAQVPPLSQWTLGPGVAWRPEEAALTFGGIKSERLLASSPPMEVMPGMEYVFEYSGFAEGGRLKVALEGADTGAPGQAPAAVTPPEFPPGQRVISEAKYIIPLKPGDTRRVAIKIYSRIPGQSGAGLSGAFRVLRFLGIKESAHAGSHN